MRSGWMYLGPVELMPASMDGVQHTWPVTHTNLSHAKEEIRVLELCPLVARGCGRGTSGGRPGAVCNSRVDLLNNFILLSRSIILFITVAITIVVAIAIAVGIIALLLSGTLTGGRCIALIKVCLEIGKSLVRLRIVEVVRLAALRGRNTTAANWTRS